MKPDKVVADKTYDAYWLLHYLNSGNIEAVIPPKKSWLAQRAVDYKLTKKEM